MGRFRPHPLPKLRRESRSSLLRTRRVCSVRRLDEDVYQAKRVLQRA